MNDNFYRSSGAAIAIRRIAEGLDGIRYCVAGTGDRGPEDISWVPPHDYAQFHLKTTNPLRLLTELNRFRAWFAKQGCNLVHCHHRRLAVVLRLAGIPVLYTGQLAFPQEAWFRFLHPKCMTAITPSVAENILETTGTRVLTVIGNPAPFPSKPPHIDVAAVRSRAVCIARLDPVKGHKHLLSAWQILHDRGHSFELHLVGEGALRRELEAQAKNQGISHLIHFRGYTNDVSGILATCLFAILVSEVEGQGLVTLEAAAMGRASLLTAVPGSIDMLPPGTTLQNGVEYGHTTQLADALEEWFTNPEQVVREGQLFFAWHKQSSDAQRIAQEYKKVYWHCIERHA
jgi:glycosyltransferase involved in cell wall biosynthesis